MRSLFFLLVANSAVFCQTYIFGEYSVNTKFGNQNKYSAIWAQQGLSGKVGVFGWAEIFDDNYKQAYGGLSYQINKDLQLGAGLGAQSGAEKKRFAGFLYYEKGKYSNFFITEKSPKDVPFLFNQFNRRIGDSPFGIGSLLYSPVGLGPRFEINVSFLKFYIAPLYGPKNGPNLFYGIRWIYSKDK